MDYYKPKRVRWGRVLAGFIRGLSALLARWPLILIVAVVVSPISPHMRFEYTYRGYGSYRYMLSCKYLGSRGFVNYTRRGECPLFVIIDGRKK